MERKSAGTMCVTGGAGYIGSWLIMRLLDRGYSVRATVRLDPEINRDLSHLTTLPGASDRLQIFNADLNLQDSFNDAIQGCDGVFHVAHPVEYEGNEIDEAKVKMAVEGTNGILRACVKSKTVKRVVYTSSTAAVMFNQTALMEMDENTWSDIDLVKSIKPTGSSYIVSKTLAEQAAIRFSEESGLDVVTLSPSCVTGPFICPHLPASVYLALALIMGNSDRHQFLSNGQMVHIEDIDRHNFLNNVLMVHIEDIVEAHIFLMECPTAKGRYICSQLHSTGHELAKFLSIKYPDLEIPLDPLKEIEEIKPIHLSSKKLRDLGFEFKYGLNEMFDGAIQSCKEKGFL